MVGGGPDGSARMIQKSVVGGRHQEGTVSVGDVGRGSKVSDSRTHGRDQHRVGEVEEEERKSRNSYRTSDTRYPGG